MTSTSSNDSVSAASSAKQDAFLPLEAAADYYALRTEERRPDGELPRGMLFLDGWKAEPNTLAHMESTLLELGLTSEELEAAKQERIYKGMSTAGVVAALGLPLDWRRTLGYDDGSPAAIYYPGEEGAFMVEFDESGHVSGWKDGQKGPAHFSYGSFVAAPENTNVSRSSDRPLAPKAMVRSGLSSKMGSVIHGVIAPSRSSAQNTMPAPIES